MGFAHTFMQCVINNDSSYNFYPFQLGAKLEHVAIGHPNPYYLGEADSNQGDLYKFVEDEDGQSKAYLVGVVRQDSAGFNKPRIYTDVAKYKNWILKHTEDGSCS